MTHPDWTLRPALPEDEPVIRALVRLEKLNPTGLRWPTFLVAEMQGEIVGAAQMRRHRDGSRELGSLVVGRAHRDRGIAESLISALVTRETGPIHIVTARVRAGRYRRWGFEKVAVAEAAGPVRWNMRMGLVAGGLASLLRGRRPTALVILRRAAAGASTADRQP